MKRLLRSQLAIKRCAALVMITWLATLVSIWGMQEAGHRAVAPTNGSEPSACQLKDLEGLVLQLEMAHTPDVALKILRGDKNSDAPKTACIRSGMAAQISADYLLIPAYSGLTLALFLFVRALWNALSPEEQQNGRWGILALGVLLALAMLIGDVVENRQLTALIDLAENRLPVPGDLLPALRYAGDLKWGALAASALLLAMLWKSRSSPRLVWVLRLLGLAAGALFVAGLVRTDWQIVSWGVYILSTFWLTALVHAVAVAVEPESTQTTDFMPERARQP